MATLTIYTEYSQLLSRVFKSAFIVYMFYDKFKNDAGVVQFTYNDLNEHLGFATSTIQKANLILKKLKLIEEVEEDSSAKRYRLLPVQPLDEVLRQEILKEFVIEDYNTATALRTKHAQDFIPPDFQQLLNKKVLKQAFKELGSEFRNGKTLCKHFKIDFHTFKLLHERPKGSYKSRLNKLIQEVEEECAPKKKAVKDSKFTAEAQELTKHLYDKLAELDAKPIGGWWLKNCNVAQNLLSKGLSLEEGKQMIDWGFANDWWKDKMSDIKVLDNIGTKYRLDRSKKDKNSCKITRDTELPVKVQEELKGISKFSVKTYEDAYMLKQSILNGENKKDIVKIVNILEQHGIVPAGQSNLNFG